DALPIWKVVAEEMRAAAVTNKAHPRVANPNNIRCGRPPSSVNRAGSTVTNHNRATTTAARVAISTAPAAAKNVSQMRMAADPTPKANERATQTSFTAAATADNPSLASANNIKVLSLKKRGLSMPAN